MKKVFLFLAEGFEETEAVATLDILLRGGLDVTSVSITGNRLVAGAHGIAVNADTLFENADISSGDMLVLPGGMPGASNLKAHAGLKKALDLIGLNGGAPRSPLMPLSKEDEVKLINILAEAKVEMTGV